MAEYKTQIGYVRPICMYNSFVASVLFFFIKKNFFLAFHSKIGGGANITVVQK